MKILPSLSFIQDMAAEGTYDILPVSCELLSDFITPIEALKILKHVSSHCYLLESAAENETWGRYSFLGFDPKLEITCTNGLFKAGNLTVLTEDPSSLIRQILSEYKSPRFDYLPPFTGGLTGKLLETPVPAFDKTTFCAMIDEAKLRIREGDIFQIVLSNCFSAPFEGSLFQTYRILRTLNPSPYMFYFSGTDLEIAGASPETLVKLENGVVRTFPLAGTRPRGKNEAEDKKLEAELLADEKELAEHNMLVDLGRNDLGKISRFGTVQVEQFHSIQRFSHVMHIGSTVKGKLDSRYDALDAIEAVLPAGTLSGAPKIRACQLINRLEQNKRGIYGGAIGYIDFTGNMDTCIAIRIAYKKNGRVFVRSGAGIVADSDPKKEYEECLNKARSSLKALELAQEDLL